MNILDKIIASKKKEISLNKEMKPIKFLESSRFYSAKPVSLKQYVLRKDKPGIIAEFKRKSPSKPAINLNADIEKISIGYMQAGASALSVLTDGEYFGAKEEDLSIARKYNFCPILRKDFIIDSYQIIEARAMGADAILLIAEILDKTSLKELASFAKSLGLEVLVEVHSEDQLAKLNEYIDLIGVNNRDLSTFKTNIENSIQLASKLPESLVKISESGLKTASDLFTLTQNGYDGFLIGERFMAHADPVKACQKLIREYNSLLQQEIINA
jgi:indole-3-glycerol phosphate synthase